MRPIKILSDTNEVLDSEISRVAKMTIIQKCKGYGSFAEGPEYKQLISLYMRHKLGRHVQYFMIKYEPQYQRLYLILKRIKKKIEK